MQLKPSTLALLAAAVFAVGAAAQGVRVSGAGLNSCGDYLEHRARNNDYLDQVYVAWIQGFIAGFNFEVKQPTTRNTPERASMLAYVDKHCREQPLDSVVMAASALIGELGGRRNPR